MSTNDFYNTNAHSFAEGTLELDMSDFYSRLEIFLAPGMRILDVGCGPGRDLKYFSKKYEAFGLEPSLELCKIAKEFSGREVVNSDLLSFESSDKFDAIWACASLLHIESHKLESAFNKVSTLLKAGGFFYSSFKYGDFEGDRNGRHFTDLTENRFESLINSTGLIVKSHWLTSDIRPGRENEKWLNSICQKSL